MNSTSVLHKVSITTIGAVLITLGNLGSAAAASLYSITDLGALVSSDYSYADDINDLGQVIFNSGFGTSNGSPGRSFLYSNGQITEINPLPGDTDIGVTSINNFGQVVGNSVNSNTFSDNHALIYSNGKTQSLGFDGIPYDNNDSGQVVGGTTGGGIFPKLAFPAGAAFLYSGGTTTIINNNLNANYVAYGMNNLSQVVGIFGAPSRAFLYDNGTFTNLGTLPGDNYSSAEKINDLGQVVGVSAPTGANNGQAFLYSRSTGLINLGKLLPSDLYSVAFDINNNGHVVGISGSNFNFYSGGGTGIHAFLYSDGILQDLNNLISPNSGFTITQARAINNSEQIVGAATLNGQLHAVLLTPKPTSTPVSEPTSIFGLLALGGMFGISARQWQS